MNLERVKELRDKHGLLLRDAVKIERAERCTGVPYKHESDELDALRARVARLEEALRGVLPPDRGEYGGPLVEMIARYEDGSPTERITPMLAKMHIRHEAVARARRALEEK